MKSLYEITGDIKDFNTVLVSRASLRPREYTDAELAAIYKKANGEDTGKAKPLFTSNIFRAMRAMADERRLTQP